MYWGKNEVGQGDGAVQSVEGIQQGAFHKRLVVLGTVQMHEMAQHPTFACAR